jgi:adenine/guanine phosphoribosyltransferase-like PRPP-binding protein
VATIPPQGASAPGPYAALELARAAAAILGVPLVEVLARTDTKRWHGPHHALKQAPFVATLPEPRPTMVLVLDDLVTSGRTLRLSIEALNRAGCAAFGFAFSGC